MTPMEYTFLHLRRWLFCVKCGDFTQAYCSAIAASWQATIHVWNEQDRKRPRPDS